MTNLIYNKKCNKCGFSFETNIEKRKYCYKCSPFLEYLSERYRKNTIKIINEIEHKRCNQCHLFFENIEKFFIKTINGYLIGKCKKCSYKNECKRKLEVKIKCIEYKGGKCVYCHYNKCTRALEFHHIDPSKKDFSISHSSNKPFHKLKPELDKCILVCSNCHAEIHANLDAR